MTIADEAAPPLRGIQSAQYQGLDDLSREQQVTFTQYTRYVLPLDGYVFWVATGAMNVVMGSLHYATEKQQEEDETLAVNSIIFSAQSEVQFLNTVQPGTMWIGSIEMDPDPDGTPAPILIAFARQGPYYKEAGVYHYAGFTVYPALQSQIVNSSSDLLAMQPIVSNSLPIWLSQNSFAPVFPSFLVPDNLPPPYVVAHIEPSGTEAIQQFPVFQWPGVTQVGSPAPLHDLPSSQLMRDRVLLTLYGFNNQRAIQFYASLIEYSLNTENFGFGNSPAIRDEKRNQVEISAIAQKKTIEIVANYYQATADAIARRLILSASISTTVTTP